MVRLERGTHYRAAGNRSSLASRRVQALLDVAPAASETWREKVRGQRTARAMLNRCDRFESFICARINAGWREDSPGGLLLDAIS